MRRNFWRSWLITVLAAAVGWSVPALAQSMTPAHPAGEPPVPDTTPPANGNLSDKLSKSDGTIKPLPNEDPGMTAKPAPKTNDPMPVVQPPPVTSPGDIKPEPKRAVSHRSKLIGEQFFRQWPGRTADSIV